MEVNDNDDKTDNDDGHFRSEKLARAFGPCELKTDGKLVENIEEIRAYIRCARADFFTELENVYVKVSYESGGKRHIVY